MVNLFQIWFENVLFDYQTYQHKPNAGDYRSGHLVIGHLFQNQPLNHVIEFLMVGYMIADPAKNIPFCFVLTISPTVIDTNPKQKVTHTLTHNINENIITIVKKKKGIQQGDPSTVCLQPLTNAVRDEILGSSDTHPANYREERLDVIIVFV
jgi:hypothetical protein